jgi:hypothetical protein
LWPREKDKGEREREVVGGGICFSPRWCFHSRLKGPLLSWVETSSGIKIWSRVAFPLEIKGWRQSLPVYQPELKGQLSQLFRATRR